MSIRLFAWIAAFAAGLAIVITVASAARVLPLLLGIFAAGVCFVAALVAGEIWLYRRLHPDVQRPVPREVPRLVSVTVTAPPGEAPRAPRAIEGRAEEVP